MIILLSLLACDTSEEEPSSTETEQLPDYLASGDAQAGTLSADIVGSTGVELTVEVWYPSDEQGDEVLYDGFIEGEAHVDVTPRCDTPRPVLMFSHGSGGIRWQSTFLTEHMASHGWLIAAPDHTYNTFLDGDSERFVEVILRRPVDIQDSYDWLVAQSADPNSPLAGCVDEAEGYAVAGHSFGGYTTYAVAGADIIHPETEAVENLGDPRVWAAVAFAPWDAGGTISGGNAAIEVPVMTIGGTLDGTTPWSMISRLHGELAVTPRYLGEMPAGGHYTFSPIACVIYQDGDGCGDGFLEMETAEQLVRLSTMAFLEEVRGQQGAIDQLPTTDPALVWEIVE